MTLIYLSPPCMLVRGILCYFLEILFTFTPDIL